MTPVAQNSNQEVKIDAKSPQSYEVAMRAAEGQILRQYGKHWEDVAKEIRIFGPSGDPSPGLAKKIVDQGYEPKTIETRTRCGFDPICPSCNRKIRKQKHVTPDQLLNLPIQSTPPDLLRWQLEHRINMV